MLGSHVVALDYFRGTSRVRWKTGGPACRNPLTIMEGHRTRCPKGLTAPNPLLFPTGSRFQHQYGCLRNEVLKTYDEYLNCGILAHGAARVFCDGCKHSLLVALSCKRRRVCPSCGAKRAVKFAEHIYNEVIEDVPNRHTVFTITNRLRVFSK